MPIGRKIWLIGPNLLLKKNFQIGAVKMAGAAQGRMIRVRKKVCALT